MSDGVGMGSGEGAGEMWEGGNRDGKGGKGGKGRDATGERLCIRPSHTSPAAELMEENGLQPSTARVAMRP